MNRFEITEEDHLKFSRLDQYLASIIENTSRTTIKKYILEKRFESTLKLDPKKLPPVGTVISFQAPEAKPTNNLPQNIPLNIIFEDEHLIVINKQAGLVIHPAPGNPDGTLVNALLHHCKDLKGVGDELRPGIVHRLDKGTTGVMVAAKNQQTHMGLVELFSKHDIQREYEMLVLGNRINENIKIESLFDRNPHNRLKMTSKTQKGKKAITHIQSVTHYDKISHVSVTLETGRTHQIRVHLAEELNSPLLNDKLYGREKEERHLLSKAVIAKIGSYQHPFLHARLLGFIHPVTKENLSFSATAPTLFNDVLDILKDAY